MVKIWKWVLRPVVIAIAGAGGVRACEEAPVAGAIFILLSLVGVAWLLHDIYLALRSAGVF